MHVSKGKGGNIKREISGVGARLAGLLKRREIEIASFQRALRKAGVPGSGYSTVFGYLQGRVEPAPEFVRAAASELGVRFGWLMTGEDEETEAEQRVTSVEQGGPSNRELTEYVGKQGWTASTQALFFGAWRRYVAGMPGGNVPDYELLFLGMLLVDLVSLPVDHWGFKHKLSDRETNDLAVAALHWLMLAMPEPGTGDSFHYLGVLYAHGFDLRYVEDRAERMQALADEAREKLADADARMMELGTERERDLARIKALSKRLSKEGTREAEAVAAFEELRQELGLTDMTTEEEDSDV